MLKVVIEGIRFVLIESGTGRFTVAAVGIRLRDTLDAWYSIGKDKQKTGSGKNRSLFFLSDRYGKGLFHHYSTIHAIERNMENADKIQNEQGSRENITLSLLPCSFMMVEISGIEPLTS